MLSIIQFQNMVKYYNILFLDISIFIYSIQNIYPSFFKLYMYDD
jgi:hypothetical protein